MPLLLGEKPSEGRGEQAEGGRYSRDPSFPISLSLRGPGCPSARGSLEGPEVITSVFSQDRWGRGAWGGRARASFGKGSRCSPLGNLESWIFAFSSVRKTSSAESWLRSPKKIWRDGSGEEGGEEQRRWRRLAPCHRQLPLQPQSPRAWVARRIYRSCQSAPASPANAGF